MATCHLLHLETASNFPPLRLDGEFCLKLQKWVVLKWNGSMVLDLKHFDGG